MNKLIIFYLSFTISISGLRAEESSSSPRISSRTEAAIALWNKSSPVPASNALRISMQKAEDTMLAFFQANSAIDPDAVLQTKSSDKNLATVLKTYQQASNNFVTVISEYKMLMKKELERTGLPEAQQSIIAEKQSASYDLCNEWASAASKAAGAALALRSLIDRGVNSESAQQNFIDAWDSSCVIQNKVVERAQKIQNYTDSRSPK